jgi:hypothetical protein
MSDTVGSTQRCELFIIISIQPLGQFGQERCILGKFLGVVCHCSPPPPFAV